MDIHLVPALLANSTTHSSLSASFSALRSATLEPDTVSLNVRDFHLTAEADFRSERIYTCNSDERDSRARP